MAALFDIGQMKRRLNQVQPLDTSNQHQRQLCEVQ